MAKLGRQHYFLSTAPQRDTEKSFAEPDCAPVNVCRVEQRDTQFDRRVDDGRRALLRGGDSVRSTKIVAPDADR